MAVLEITNQAELDDLFAGVREDFDNLRWDDFFEDGFASVERQHIRMFARAHDVQERPWAPLAPSTIKRKVRDRAGRSPILVETGRLRDSLTLKGTEDGVRETFDNWPGQTGFVFGTEVPYSQYHMTGTKRMPARPHIGLNEETLEKIVEAAADHAIKGMKK